MAISVARLSKKMIYIPCRAESDATTFYPPTQSDMQFEARELFIFEFLFNSFRVQMNAVDWNKITGSESMAKGRCLH